MACNDIPDGWTGFLSLLHNIREKSPKQYLDAVLCFLCCLPTNASKLFCFLYTMIEVVCNDRLGKKVRVKCNEDDTVGDLKKLIAAQTGTRPEKLRIQKWYTVFKDHITLEDYEVHDGMGLELYYN